MHLGQKKPDEPRGAFMQIYPFYSMDRNFYFKIKTIASLQPQ